MADWNFSRGEGLRGRLIDMGDGTHEPRVVFVPDESILADGRIKVDAQVTVQPAEIQPISAESLPLPQGAATQATLELARALLASIEANQLPDNHSVAVSNFPVAFPTTDSQVDLLRTTREEQFLNAGQLFVGGSKVTVSNNTAILQVRNPVGSGKLVLISQFFLTADANTDIQFVKDTTVNSPTLRTPDPLNRVINTTATAELRTGVTGFTGGSSFSPVGRLSANITVGYAIPIVLSPGQSVGATFQAPALANLACYASAAWAEIPIT